MTSFTQRSISLLGILAIFTTGIVAQQPSPLPMRPAPPPPTWERAQQIAPQHRIDLVTMQKPHGRVHCTVERFTENEIACSHRFGDPTVYQRDDIKAIVSRAKTRPAWDSIFLLSSFDAGIGVAILAMALTGPIGIAGAVCLGLLTLGGNVSGADGLKQTDVEEFVMYVKPGESYKNVQGAPLNGAPLQGITPARRT